MITINMDNRSLTVQPGATLLDAARSAGIHVPTLCYRDGMEHVTSCMLCVVEDLRTSSIVPACSTLAENGMRIATASESVLEARRAAITLLLGDHAGDCEGPCRRACPAGMDIPGMLRSIAAGDMREAIRIVKRHIAIPAILGRICPVPCEKICRRGMHDAPVAICLLKRHAADADLYASDSYAPAIPEPSGYRVAVVGAGPAGLAAAYTLACEGHACALFEKQSRPGGGLRAPELHSKLPPEILEDELARIILPGITLETGTELGRQISIDALKREFDAVILACGEACAGILEKTFPEASGQDAGVPFSACRTPDPVVFSCVGVKGSMPMAVRALAKGRSAALAVNRMLSGDNVAPSDVIYNHRLWGKPDPDEMAVFMAGVAGAGRHAPTGGLKAGYTDLEAQREASRCLHCDCRKPVSCKLRQYAGMLGISATAVPAGPDRLRVKMIRHGRLIYEPGKCIRCGICIRITEAAGEPLGLAFTGRGFDVRVSVPFNEPLTKGLRKVADECVEACPTGALSIT